MTSEEATPETDISPVQQRLATAKKTLDPNNPKSKIPNVRTASHRQPSEDPASSSDTPPQAASQTTSTDSTLAAPPQRLAVPPQYEGVDVTELLSALGDAPAEVQKAAIGRLIAMSRKQAKPTGQPRAIEDALAASFDSLPVLPDEVIDRGVSPTRIAASSQKPQPEIQEAKFAKTKESHAHHSVAAASPHVTNPKPVTKPKPFAVATATTVRLDDHSSDIQTVAAESDPSDPSNVSHAAIPMIPSESVVSNESVPSSPASPSSATSELTDAELFDALVARLQKQTKGESEADRHRRIVMARHLMVLSGDPDRAVEKLEGLSNEEEEFLRHHLLGLWTIIDPNGHPVPSRRLSSALPQIRKATGFLAAASDSLEVRGLEFCTEIEAYGEVKPFPKRRFTPGQEVILYCEVENFVSSNVDGGFETRLQGSYDLLDQNGRRVSSQTLPQDQQVSKNRLRDYFVAYQMYLPDAIEPGRYQLRLTMEDIHGKKYGQSTIDFEIKR